MAFYHDLFEEEVRGTQGCGVAQTPQQCLENETCSLHPSWLDLHGFPPQVHAVLRLFSCELLALMSCPSTLEAFLCPCRAYGVLRCPS